MSLGDPYITGQDLADYAGMDTTNPDTVRDAQLLSAVSSASRAITMACGRDFNKETTATPRVFKPNGPRIILTDDFYTATNLIIQTGRIRSASRSIRRGRSCIQIFKIRASHWWVMVKIKRASGSPTCDDGSSCCTIKNLSCRSAVTMIVMKPV